MKEYLKMADVFVGEYKPKRRIDAWPPSRHGETLVELSGSPAQYAAHAINSHDELVAINKELLAAMGEHLAEQDAQLLCMAKRIEEFESKYKAAMEVVRDLVELPYSTGGLLERLEVRERARDLLAGRVGFASRGRQ